MFLLAAVPWSGMPTVRSHPTCSVGQPKSFSIPIPQPSSLSRHILPDPQFHVTLWAAPETWSLFYGICLLVSHRVLPHLAVHRAPPGSAQGLCQGLRLLPVYGEMSCHLPCCPQPAHLLVRATRVQSLTWCGPSSCSPITASLNCLHVVSAHRPSLCLTYLYLPAPLSPHFSSPTPFLALLVLTLAAGSSWSPAAAVVPRLPVSRVPMQDMHSCSPLYHQM